MNNELVATIKNILKINDIQNDDLTLMLSRYIQQNFSKNTSIDVFTEKDYYIQEKIVKVSVAIATNCDFAIKVGNRKNGNSMHCREKPTIKNYIEFENFNELNDWVVALYERMFKSKATYQNEIDIEKKLQVFAEDIDKQEIIPFKLPCDFFISIFKTGVISSDKIINYLGSLRSTINDGAISSRKSDIKSGTIFCSNFDFDEYELYEQFTERQISNSNDSSGNMGLSFSQKVENELQRLDQSDEGHSITNFMIRMGFFGEDSENIETRISTLEEMIIIFNNTTSSFKSDLNVSDIRSLFLNSFNKTQFIHLLRRNISSLNILNRFLLIKVLHKGNFGDIYVGLDLISFKLVCLKRLAGHISDSQYLNNSIIEANYLKVLSRSVISEFVPYFIDVAVSNNNIFIISELQGKNLLSVIKHESAKSFLTLGRIQRIIYQLLICIMHLHESFKLIHCDIKPENIVINSVNAHDVFEYLNDTQLDKNEINIKLIDWGSCISISSASKARNSYIQSRYYRSPEVCLGLPYNEKIDIWSIGCVMAELVLRKPLFDYCSSSQQLLANIITTIGKIPMHMISNSTTIDHFITHDGHLFDTHSNKVRLFTALHEGYRHRNRISELFDTENDPLFVDLLYKLLCIDPDKRLSASQALSHPWFKSNNSSLSK